MKSPEAKTLPGIFMFAHTDAAEISNFINPSNRGISDIRSVSSLQLRLHGCSA